MHGWERVKGMCSASAGLVSIGPLLTCCLHGCIGYKGCLVAAGRQQARIFAERGVWRIFAKSMFVYSTFVGVSQQGTSLQMPYLLSSSLSCVKRGFENLINGGNTYAAVHSSHVPTSCVEMSVLRYQISRMHHKMYHSPQGDCSM